MNKSELLVMFGDLYSRDGEKEKAKTCYNKALIKDSKCGYAYQCLGDLATEEDKWEQAISWYRSALKYCDSRGLRINLANAYYNLGWHSKAYVQFKIAEKLALNCKSDDKRVFKNNLEYIADMIFIVRAELLGISTKQLS